MAVTDHITVLRDGRGGRPHGHGRRPTRRAIVRAMTGRNVTLKVDKAPAEAGRPLLEGRGAGSWRQPGKPAVDGVSFAVRAGEEIVGIAGVARQQPDRADRDRGRTQGRRCARAIRVDGRDVTAAGSSPAAALPASPMCGRPRPHRHRAARQRRRQSVHGLPPPGPPARRLPAHRLTAGAWPASPRHRACARSRSARWAYDGAGDADDLARPRGEGAVDRRPGAAAC